MSNSSYVLQSLVYSLAGGVIGFIAGSLHRLDHLRRHPDMTVTPDTPHRKLLIRPSLSQVIGALIAVMAMASTFLLVVQAGQYNKASDCLAAYAESYTAALRGRDDIASQSRQAAREYAIAHKTMWARFLATRSRDVGQPATQAQVDAMVGAVQGFFTANDGYVDALNNSDRAKLTYPIPDNRCPKPRHANYEPTPNPGVAPR